MVFRDGEKADRLARHLNGDMPTSHDPKIVAMLAAARALAPSETPSESRRARTLKLALRELQRTTTPPPEKTNAGTRDGDAEIAPHIARVTTTDGGVEVVMADIETIGEDRAEAAAEHAVELIARVRAEAAAEESR